MLKQAVRIALLAVALVGGSLVAADELILTSLIVSTLAMAAATLGFGWYRADRSQAAKGMPRIR